MPPRRNNSEPPKVISRSKSTPIIAWAIVFDAARAFFTMFWFFGPALAGMYCTSKLSGTLGGATATVCAAAATIGGVSASEITTPFGVIMADAVGFLGFLTLLSLLILFNARLLKAVKTSPLQFAGAFLIAEIPFLGAFPVYTVILWRLYGVQIKVEKEELAAWEAKNALAIAQEQQMIAQIQMRQIQDAEEQEFEAEEAANDDATEEDEEETPNHTQLAA